MNDLTLPEAIMIALLGFLGGSLGSWRLYEWWKNR